MRIVWTIGDIHGIGPEIILKSFLKVRDSGDSFIVAGSLKALEFYRDRLNLPVRIEAVDTVHEITDNLHREGILPVLSVAEPDIVTPGSISKYAGTIAMQAVETAAGLCQSGLCDGMVTAPIHKEAVSLAGFRTTGHTDFLAAYFGVRSPIMLFVDPVSNLKVALATIHIPLSLVPPLIRTLDFEEFFVSLDSSIRKDFHIDNPSFAVLGLNPHASDGGVMGNEEASLITPCIKKLAGTVSLEGPFPADGFFGAQRHRGFDVTIAMYHDQGLLPFKVLAFETGINVTLGLPVVRTSPDHGTGFDKAGKGSASERSFYEATLMAMKIARNRSIT